MSATSTEVVTWQEPLLEPLLEEKHRYGVSSTTTDSMPDGLRFLFDVEDKITAALNKINRYLRNL